MQRMRADLFCLGEYMEGYIYQIINTKNKKRYIGQTLDIEKRKRTHFWGLKNNRHPNRYLQNSFNKHGEKVFDFNVIENNIPLKEIDKKERDYIKKFDSANSLYGYNLRSGGKRGNLGPRSRKQISEKLKGHAVSLETRKKMSKIHKGKRITKLHRKKVSGGLFGFRGVVYHNYKEKRKPWRKVWKSRIMFNSKSFSLGFFNDPLSAQIVYDLCLSELT